MQSSTLHSEVLEIPFHRSAHRGARTFHRRAAHIKAHIFDPETAHIELRKVVQISSNRFYLLDLPVHPDLPIEQVENDLKSGGVKDRIEKFFKHVEGKLIEDLENFRAKLLKEFKNFDPDWKLDLFEQLIDDHEIRAEVDSTEAIRSHLRAQLRVLKRKLRRDFKNVECNFYDLFEEFDAGIYSVSETEESSQEGSIINF